MKKLHTIIILLAVTLCLGLTATTASAGLHHLQPNIQLAFFPPPPPFLAPFLNGFFNGWDSYHYRNYDPTRRYYRHRHYRHDRWDRDHRGDWSWERSYRR